MASPILPWRRGRLIAGALIVTTLAFGAYLIMDAEAASPGTISITFLLVMPMSLSAFGAYWTDPDGSRGLGHYMGVPAVLTGMALAAGAILFREGLICLIMLSPLWLAAGAAGSGLTYWIRRRLRERGRLFCSVALLLPIFTAQAEALTPPQAVEVTVGRETIIDAPPARVWPLLTSVEAIRAEEGRWNIAQDLLGVPRPTAALIERRGSDLVRRASWGADIRFEENITHSEPLRTLAWTFAFPDDSVQRHTDRHISPNGAHLKIERGSYSLSSASGGRTRLRLDTIYLVRTRLNPYAIIWGEILLGGIQDNVLAIIAGRAENPDRPTRS